MSAATRSPLAVLALALACSGQAVDDPNVDRHPLGKADAAGSCKSADGDDFCGGQSDGACWCDDECVRFGDCCSDVVAVCEGIDLSVASIDSSSTFDTLAFAGEGNIIIGKSVKFLIDNRKPTEPKILYQNANFDGPVSNPDAKRFHYFFGREVFDVTEGLAEFNQVTYNVQDKRYFAGTLQEYRLGKDAAPLYAIQFYPQDVAAEETIVTAVKIVRESFSIPEARLAFVATGQQQTTATVDAKIREAGVENLTLDQVLGELDYLPMQLGEAWGFLRIFPENQDHLTALDIPVFDELPLDLTVVAGTITHAVQDASSHINLKAKERGTPNMVLRSASTTHEILSRFADQPVHLVVGADGFTIEPSTEEEVRAKLAEKLDKPWRELTVDNDAEIASFDEMCVDDAGGCLTLAPKFGGKSGGLGFLRHPDVLGTVADQGSMSNELGYEAAAVGIGVPVHHYFAFIKNNPELEQEIADFVKAEKEGTLSVADRVTQLDAIRLHIMAAELPEGFAQEVEEQIKSVLPATAKSAKIRSSANAEDIPGFDGAGLYDSFRAKFGEVSEEPCHTKLDEDDGSLDVRPRTFDCVIKGVYASLWNKRAVEERSFARIDHATAGMGLAIVQRYEERAKIAANSVVVTRVLNSSGVFGYTFATQVGDNVVTNPAPGTQSESVIAGFIPDAPSSFTVTRFAKPKAADPVRTTTIMTEKQMLQMLDISQAIELAYCKAKPDYYDGSCSNVTLDIDKPTSLDMETKLYENGELLFKQVREFSGK